VRVATGNIAACIGLHAGWVWVMLIAHEGSAPRPDAQLGFLLSRFDGFVGWLVLAATLVMAVPLWRFFHRPKSQEAISADSSSVSAGQRRGFGRLWR